MPYCCPVMIFFIQGTPQVFELCHPLHQHIPLPLYKLNSISHNLWLIYMSLHCKRTSVSLSYQAVCLCLNNRSGLICIPQWSHRGIVFGPSCRIIISSFQFRYIKFSLILPGLCAFSRHPSTRHTTYFNTHGQDTTYLFSPPLPTSNNQVCGITILWDCSMEWWRYNDSDK